jgi:hypothetical protein
MGGQFAWSAAEFTEEIRRLGPNPLNDTAAQVTDLKPLISQGE